MWWPWRKEIIPNPRLKVHRKLVRRDVIAPLEARGIKVVWSTVKDFPSRDRLSREKVVEEAREVLETKTRDELVGEIADLASWTDMIMEVHNISQEELLAAMADKDAKKGPPSFIYMESTEEPDDPNGQQH